MGLQGKAHRLPGGVHAAVGVDDGADGGIGGGEEHLFLKDLAVADVLDVGGGLFAVAALAHGLGRAGGKACVEHHGVLTALDGAVRGGAQINGHALVQHGLAVHLDRQLAILKGGDQIDG